jgi:hypothetical protein
MNVFHRAAAIRKLNLHDFVRSFRMNLIPFAVVCVPATVMAALAISAQIKRRGQHRALSRLAGLCCPQCRHPYGDAIRHTASPVTYNWTPARGRSVSSLRLPRSTFLFHCEECSAEYEFTRDGRIFEHPQTGVLSFERTGRLRALPPFGTGSRSPRFRVPLHGVGTPQS